MREIQGAATEDKTLAHPSIDWDIPQQDGQKPEINLFDEFDRSAFQNVPHRHEADEPFAPFDSEGYPNISPKAKYANGETFAPFDSEGYRDVSPRAHIQDLIGSGPERIRIHLSAGKDLKASVGEDSAVAVKRAEGMLAAALGEAPAAENKKKADQNSKRDAIVEQMRTFASGLNAENAAGQRDALQNQYNYKLRPDTTGNDTLGTMEFKGGVSLDKKLQAAAAEAIVNNKDVVVVHGKHRLYVTPTTDLAEKFADIRGLDRRRGNKDFRVEETANDRRLIFENKAIPKHAIQTTIDEARAEHKNLSLTLNGYDLGQINGNSTSQDLKAKYDKMRKAAKPEASEQPKERPAAEIAEVKPVAATVSAAERIENQPVTKAAEPAEEAAATTEKAQQPGEDVGKQAPEAIDITAAPKRQIEYAHDNLTVESFRHPSGFSLVRDTAGQTDAQSMLKPQYRILTDKGEAIGTFSGRLTVGSENRLFAFPSRNMLADDLRKFETVAEQLGLRKMEPGKAMSAFTENQEPPAQSELIDNRAAEFEPGYAARQNFFYPDTTQEISVTADKKANDDLKKRPSEMRPANLEMAGLGAGIGASSLRNEPTIIPQEIIEANKAILEAERAGLNSSRGKAGAIAGGAAAAVGLATEAAEAAGLLK